MGRDFFPLDTPLHYVPLEYFFSIIIGDKVEL